MAKFVPITLIESMLNLAEGTHVTICTAQPTSYAEVSTYGLGTKAISGAYSMGPGGFGGRKNTLPAQTDITIDQAGQAAHVAVHNNTDTLYLVTTCAAVNLQIGDSVDTNAFGHEIEGAI